MFELSRAETWAPAIHAADPGSFWFWSFVLCLLAIAALLAGFVFLLRAWLVKETPVSLVRSAAQGYVKLEGHADLMPGPAIASPLTGTRCAWWSYSIQERSSGGRNRNWEQIEHGTSDDLFLIRDTSGQCVVDPTHAEVIPATENVWYGAERRPLTGPTVGGFALSSKYRYMEKLIRPSEFIFALGFFHSQGGEAGVSVINDEVSQLLHTWKQNQADLLRRFDTDHNGQIDAQEWEIARQAARQQVLTQEQAEAQRPPVDVLAQPTDGRRFLISTRSETGVIARFRLWAAGCLLVFVVLGAIDGYMITTRLSMPVVTQSVANPSP
ncbi:MAG: GIDE domain-containing protein [Gammaproteobacteria bacterium]